MSVASRFHRDFVMAVCVMSRTGICISVLIKAQHMAGGGEEQGYKRLR